MHALWWICVKERNRLATEKVIRDTRKLGYGAYESEEREKTVCPTAQPARFALTASQIKLTQRAIKHTLTERWYAWEEARKVARADPEINLNAAEGEPMYAPAGYDQVCCICAPRANNH